MAATYNYGAAPTYVKIASYTVPSAVASYTFSNIPQGYTDLVIITQAGVTASGNAGYMRVGNSSVDTGTNYSTTYITGNGSTAVGGRYTSSSLGVSFLQPGWGNPAFLYTTGVSNIMNYANTTTYKTVVSRSGSAGTATASGVASEAGVGSWRSTAAINIITLYPEASTTWLSGSTFTIYGIKAALVPKASGGDIIVQDGSYWYHAFLSTGSFQPKQSLSCDVLVVAGGGSGGSDASGGGGAGGVIAFASQSLSTAQTVTIGAGGAGNATKLSEGNNGTNSTFSSLTAAVGGGRGGGGANGSTGGSGGGNRITGFAGTSGQGNAGAGGVNSGAYPAGGGGGAGGAGSAGASTTGGAGGAGTNSVTNWGALSSMLSATGLGVSGYIAGGGGGGTASGTGGAAGSGGATGGVISPNFSGNAIANTGSGSGGAGDASGTTGSGGSGLVIVRYSI